MLVNASVLIIGMTDSETTRLYPLNSTHSRNAHRQMLYSEEPTFQIEQQASHSPELNITGLFIIIPFAMRFGAENRLVGIGIIAHSRPHRCGRQNMNSSAHRTARVCRYRRSTGMGRKHGIRKSGPATVWALEIGVMLSPFSKTTKFPPRRYSAVKCLSSLRSSFNARYALKIAAAICKPAAGINFGFVNKPCRQKRHL